MEWNTGSKLHLPSGVHQITLVELMYYGIADPSSGDIFTHLIGNLSSRFKVGRVNDELSYLPRWWQTRMAAVLPNLNELAGSS